MSKAKHKKKDSPTPCVGRRSAALFRRARAVMPGGVNSPVRAFNAVGGEPLYVVSGKGSRILTADGAELIDFCGSWGPLILGHARPEVCEAVCAAAREGTSFGINTEREVAFAELLCRMTPGMERVRLVNSGTEAVMTALRIARGATGRRLLLKFDGCYHGHADAMLVSAGSGLLTGGIGSSAGVTAACAAETLVAPYNDAEAVRTIAARHGRELAAIIVEPVAGNMGLVPPAPGFLEELRKIALSCGAVLIFDEVITGFRLGLSTYAGLIELQPDLICLGKIIGGGMPLGAVGGRAALMDCLAPEGRVYQAGTLAGNPVAVAAGLAALRLLEKERPYPRLEALGRRLEAGLEAAVAETGARACISRLGGMFTVFFRPQRPRNLAEARECDAKAFAAFFRGMLRRGMYLPPSQFETAFISAAHTEDDVERFIEAARQTLLEMRR